VQKGLFRNAYCKDMSKILFVQNTDDQRQSDFEVFKAKPADRNEDGQPIQSQGEYDDISIRKAQDIEQAIRCLRLTDDGKQLACGDWYGNIRVHDMESQNFEEIKCIEAHENEVLCLDFVKIVKKHTVIESQITENMDGYLLVSGSRDHLIQLYDSNNDYEAV